MACRKRLKPKKPGIRPKNVGEAPTLNRGRFDWRTHCPFDRKVRTMNGSPVTFANDTLGEMFQRPCEKLPDRPNSGVQSSDVVNRRAKTRSVTVYGEST